MDDATRDKAAVLAAQMICAVIDQDAEAANILVTEAGFEVTGQACLDLARWIVNCVEGDMDEFRAGIAHRLQRIAAGLPFDLDED